MVFDHLPSRVLIIFHTCTEETTKLHSQDEQFHERVKELAALAKKTAELTDTVVALAQVGRNLTPLNLS